MSTSRKYIQQVRYLRQSNSVRDIRDNHIGCTSKTAITKPQTNLKFHTSRVYGLTHKCVQKCNYNKNITNCLNI